MSTTKRRKPRSFGKIKHLKSGRFHASYLDPKRPGERINAPTTFANRADASAWLAGVQTDMSRGQWQRPDPPRNAVPIFGPYAERWLELRDLTPKTRQLYQGLLTGHILPRFGPLRLDEIDAEQIRRWHEGLKAKTGKTRRAHAYALLRTILNSAVDDELITRNPARIKGAGSTKRAKTIRPATLEELAIIREAMREEYRLAVDLAAWCALRFGEVADLRRKDVVLDLRVIMVREAVSHVAGQAILGDPKASSMRDVTIPPHLIEPLREHLDRHVGRKPTALLFRAPATVNQRSKPSPDTERHLRSDGALHRDFAKARMKAGRPDLTFHGLRHTGLTYAAQAGATLAELMERAGHATPNAAMLYQHSAADRQRQIAERLSGFADGKVIALRGVR